MKKVFIQFGQWILKHKKRLIYGALALFVGQIFFFNIGGVGIQSEVFADDIERGDQRAEFKKIVGEKLEFLDFFKKAVYILIYPVIFLAGKLVDNSFVYGEIFNFDVVLWKLWNIVRNLANYGLGFLFLYYIFRYLIKKDEKQGPKWIIKNALIAGIGIQASWFIMAVLIDISTILIYSVGGLPISVLGGGSTGSDEKAQDYDPYIMKTIISVDANDILNMNVYLANVLTGNGEQIYISECDTFSFEYVGGQSLTEDFIFAPKMVYYKDEKKSENGGEGTNYHPTQKLLCHYYGSVYWFSSLAGELGSDKFWGGCSTDKECKDKQGDYNGEKTTIKNNIKKEEQLNAYLSSNQMLKVGKIVSENVGWDQDNKRVANKYNTRKLDQLIKNQDTKSYVGVFTTLYSSLLEAGRGMLPVEGKDTYVQFLGGFVALGHVLAISIPLLAALFVLIMRIGVIWMAIVLSPMIVLFTAFGFSEKFGNKSFLKYFKFENLIGIIFSPAVICFAISMSTVLVRLLEKISFDEVLTEPLVFGGLIQMDIAKFSVGLGRLILGIMGVAVSWFLVWLAVESSVLGETGLVKNLKGLATKALGSVEFIPVMGKDGKGKLTSINAIKNVKDQKIREFKDKFQEGDTKALNELINRSDEEDKALKAREQTKSEDYYKNYKNHLFNDPKATSGDWTQHVFNGWNENLEFSKLNSSQQEQIIKDINALKNEDKEKFGNVTGTVTIGEGDSKKIYNFNHKTKNYEIAGTSA